MRYIKKRRRSKRGSGGRNSGSFLAISVIVCGVLIYALYASSAGKWIKEKYIDPVFSQDQSNSGTSTPTTTAPKTQDSSGKEHTMSLEGFTVYAMQTGAYAGEDNASKQASEIKKQGGAGYIYKDDMYRVFAFGYANENEANVVRDQLRSVGNVDSSVYTLAVPKIDFKITGDQDSYEKVNGAFKTYLEVKDKVNSIAVRLDKKELTKEQAKSELDTLKKQLNEALTSVEKLKKGEDKLEQFSKVYKDTLSLFDGLSDSDEVIFSAGIKNIYVEMVCKYSAYIKSLSP